MNTSRPYRMTARAEAATKTGERILDAAVALFWEQPSDRLSLDEVARRADVSVQTVIRRFGGKEGLFAAAAEREAARVVAQRAAAPVDDLEAAVRVLVEHYEEVGAGVLRMIAAQSALPGLAPVVAQGEVVHRAWCERTFAPALRARRGRPRSRLHAQLVATCDVQVWHVLRHREGLSRAETERALVELLQPLTEVSA